MHPHHDVAGSCAAARARRHKDFIGIIDIEALAYFPLYSAYGFSADSDESPGECIVYYSILCL